MTTVRLRYTVRKRGKLFWQPTPEMRALGFRATPLGEDGPAAQAEALKLAAAWDKAKADQGRITSYPEGSFGAFYDRFKRTTTWAKKGPRTREDYERAWKRIDAWAPSAGAPTLSRMVITSITPDLCEQFADDLDSKVSPNERHRVVKWLKVLMAEAVVRLRLNYPSPAGRLKNPQPAGRSAIWLSAEVDRLVAGARKHGFEGMGLAIETAWQTLFSPVDVRTLRPSRMKRDAIGWYFHRNRTKTDAEAFGYLSDDLAERILAYVARQGRAEADDTPIFRTRPLAKGPGRPRPAIAYKTKDLFAKDFRLVRNAVFPGDARQFQDIRRSANVEADAAGADKETMGKLLANGLADSKFLDATYTPPTVAKAREVAEQRIQGRAKLAGEVMKARNR